jgi:signal transduction histidine kinase
MARRPAATDVLLAVVLGLEMQVELFFVDAPSGDVLAARVLLAVLAGAVLVRRQVPVAAAVFALSVLTILQRLDTNIDENLVGPFLTTLLLVYSVGAHADGRRLLIGIALLVVGTAAAIRLDVPAGGADDFLFAFTIIIAMPLSLGRLVGSRAKLNRALRDRATAAEEDRAARAAAAVAGERERIAGELHQLVHDALADMVGQATTAEASARSQPGEAAEAFTAVEATGREALGEIRQLLGVLRREDEELALAPQPSLAHLADLIARVQRSGLAVELAVEGKRGELPAGVDLTAYRVVQEALGGALEAPGERRASVHVRYGADEVQLEVTDVGDADGDGERPLLGMRERVALYGGDLVAAPVNGSGFAVRARLPLEPVA